MIALIDTSTPICWLTLVDGDESKQYSWQADRDLGKGLLAYLRDRLAENGTDFNGLHGLGVMSGPGSFTGLRIGITVFNTIASGLDIPIVGEQGDDWQSRALKRLADGENDRIVMPHYGSPANITKPRK